MGHVPEFEKHQLRQPRSRILGKHWQVGERESCPWIRMGTIGRRWVSEVSGPGGRCVTLEADVSGPGVRCMAMNSDEGGCSDIFPPPIRFPVTKGPSCCLLGAPFETNNGNVLPFYFSTSVTPPAIRTLQSAPKTVGWGGVCFIHPYIRSTCRVPVWRGSVKLAA